MADPPGYRDRAPPAPKLKMNGLGLQSYGYASLHPRSSSRSTPIIILFMLCREYAYRMVGFLAYRMVGIPGNEGPRVNDRKIEPVEQL